MTKKEPTSKVEVAHLTGAQGIRAAMAALAREAADRDEKGADGLAAERMGAPTAEGGASSLPDAVLEEVPLGRRTCSVCAADNDGSRDVCWNCGASLRRAR